MDAKTMKALANEHRIRMLRALEEGPKTYSDLLVLLGWDLERDRGKFTYHLNLLREAGLLVQENGLYRLTPGGEAALLAFEASELPPETHLRFSDYYRALRLRHRLIVVLLFVGVGLYLFWATVGILDGLQGNEVALLLGVVFLLLGVVCLFLILHALPGGKSLRWERGLLFVLVAGVYASFPLLVGGSFGLLWGILPAAVLTFLGYRALNRGTPMAA